MLSILGQEDMRNRRRCKDGGVWVQAFDLLHNLVSDWDWRVRTREVCARQLIWSYRAKWEQRHTQLPPWTTGLASLQTRRSQVGFSRKCAQLLSEALTAGRPKRTNCREHENLSRLARKLGKRGRGARWHGGWRAKPVGEQT